MSNSLHKALSGAVLHLLRPLVRVLMRHGMAYGTFAELARKAYVEEGFIHTAESGKRPTISSVSALTGLTRKETKRLRELDLVDDEASSQRYSRAIRVISGWINDSRFLNADGEPAVLPMEGEQGSFSTLVKEFSGDIPAAAMLSVLETSGTVKIGEHGIELRERAYIPSATPLEKVNILGTDTAELIATIGHNLTAEPEHLYFQRKVSNVLVNPEALPEFLEFSNKKSQALLEEYHRWLSSHEVNESENPGVTPRYVAVGIYFSDYPGSEKEPS
jgi:hypothetical protein